MAPRVQELPCPPSPNSSEGTSVSPSFSNYDLDGNPLPADVDEDDAGNDVADPRIVVVVGVGYVGEHLVQVFSKQFNVIGLDVSPARVELLKRTTFASNLRVRLTTDPTALREASLVCISVPTLLKQGNAGIDDSYVRSAVDTVTKYVTPGTTVVMESSVTVGMTRELLGHLPEKFSSESQPTEKFSSESQPTEKVYVGFSPERVDPGRIEPPADAIPKVLSGLNEESLSKIVGFYGKVYNSVVPVSSCETAEMSKLYENCFRMINIAYTNEMADACHAHGIDPHEVVQASGTKPFGFMPFSPSIGVGGHCIPVNPYYLFTNCEFPLLANATRCMEQRPSTLAEKMLSHHRKGGIPLSRVLVIGAAFKPGQSIMSYSPALTFARALKGHGCQVTIYDPLVPEKDLQKQGLSALSESDFSLATLQDNFQAVAITMRQHRVDFEVVSAFKKLGGIVETFCK